MSDEDLISYLKAVNEQVKLQQEVRDRWFGFYLTLAGAILGICIAIIKFLYEGPFIRTTVSLLLALSTLMLLIGTCFFMIYLKQRSNYLKNYITVDIIERKLLPIDLFQDHVLQVRSSRNQLSETEWEDFFVQRSHHAKANGADFYTVWIHILINSFYAACAILLGYIHLQGRSTVQEQDLGVGVFCFIVSCVVFEKIRKVNFKKQT